jgi:hypothetical protein
MTEEKTEMNFEHSDYQYATSLYKVRFRLNDSFIIEIFKNDLDLYSRLIYIQFFATKELYSLEEWNKFEHLENHELIQKRLKRRRKSALFYFFWRFSFNSGIRGYHSMHMCSAHTFKRFVKGKDSKEMLKLVIQSGREHLEEKNNPK